VPGVNEDARVEDGYETQRMDAYESARVREDQDVSQYK